MKRLLILLLIASIAAGAEYPDIKISALKAPTSIPPGGSFTIQIQVVNDGAGAAKSIQIYPDTEAPFAAKKGTEERTVVAELRHGTSIVSDFSFTVDPDTITGVYKIKFHADYKNENNQAAGLVLEVPVNIQGAPLIEITGTETNPAKITPGGRGTLLIKARNIGTDTARNLRLVWLTNASMPLQPTEGAVAYLKELGTNEEENLTISFAADGNALPGNWQIPLAILYQDAQNSEQTQIQRTATAVVEGKAELRAYVSESETLTAGKAGKITITVANTGPAEARYLYARTKPNEVSIKPSESYLKTLAPNKDDELDLEIKAEKPGIYPLKIELIYKDQYNNDITKEETFALEIAEPTKASRIGDALSEWKYIIVALIAIAAAGTTIARNKEETD